VGAVFLKRLSTAIADGDQILGTIAATAVHQNQNCTAITVPNSPSLSNLFEEVIQSAKLAPDAITFVEAHGTGTAVGDPAEYGGIRQALGGQKRSGTLALRSVKGLVGHAECASGIVALIKTLLQIQKGIITPQASHSTINPALHASSSDKIEISTHSIPWDSPFKAALINNYGASGSNASMVVTEAPPKRNAGMRDAIPDLPQPFWVSGTDDQSLHRYISKLLSLLASSTDSISLPNLAFSNTLQSNRSLGRALIFQASTIEAFKETLQSFQRNELAANEVNKQSRPVILCFGGQVSTFVGLDRHVFEHTAILRKHLDQCNLICKSMGLPGIYPDIFEREPIEDAVQFQTALFSMQYSCAKSWIDCGLQVVAVVGHSFGELVAQTVAGAMTLTDGLKVVARRACLVRDSWGSDKGSMMAVEGDLQLVEDLLARANLDESVCKYPASIACYNGPTSFTLAGSTESINRVESFLREEDSFKASIRYKRLNTSHAFHSSLVEDLTASLEQITHDIAFSSPHIPVERATKIKNTVPLSSSYIAEHLREPVYFNDAVTRLADKYKDAVWVEAGSQSTVTKMAAKALGRPLSSHFQAINLTSDGAWQRLIDDTIVLWKQGLKVDFWPHHPSQAPQYTPLILPPYQFEKVSNFIELKVQKPGANASSDESLNDKPLGLWTFMEYRDTNQKTARFRVETTHKKFQELLTGHKVANSQPLCSSTIQLEIATEAIRSLCPDFQMSDFQLDLRNLENQTPICQDDSRVVWLDVATTDDSRRKWSWKIVSNPLGGTPGIGESLHATGKVIFHRRDDAEFMDEYKRFARLVTHQRCCEVLEGQEGDDILQGSFIYKLFSDVVDYSEVFRGVRKVVGSAKGSTSAGRVVKKYSDETWLVSDLSIRFISMYPNRSYSSPQIGRPARRIC
jgi:acyl transferase domain-containing protein